MQQPRWQHFQHEADIGVRGIAADKAEAFAQAALAMMAVIADPGRVAQVEAVEVECEAPDDELLLVEWLNALVFEMATRHMLFSRFDLVLQGQRLHATAHGERIDVKKHQPVVEVKGATYTELAVYRGADQQWVAQCVVDV